MYHPPLLAGRVSVKFQIPVHRQVMFPVAFVVLVRRVTLVLPTGTGEFVNSAWIVGATARAVTLRDTTVVADPRSLLAVIVQDVAPITRGVPGP